MSIIEKQFVLLDPKYDFLSSVSPSKFYAIATTPRSGSGYFCKKLLQTGLLGAPDEHFNFYSTMIEMILRLKVHTIENYVDRLFEVRTSPNGVFGTKLFPEFYQFMHIANILWRFPNMQFIYLERKDLLSQAVSLAIAQQTKQWSGVKSSQLKPRYNYNLIAHCVNQINKSNAFWKYHFKKNNIDPIRISYEDFIKDPDKIVKNILDNFGVIPDPSSSIEVPTWEKQSDVINLKWKNKFYNELKTKNPELLKLYRV